MTAKKPPEVRIANPPDEAEVMGMCQRLHAENGAFTMNEDKVRALLRKNFAREGAIVGVIGEPGKLQASTCLQMSDFYYTNDLHLAELWNFVEKDYRSEGLGNARALIEFGKACAVKIGVPLLTGIITNKRMAGKVRMYRRILGAPAGAFFIFNSQRWASEPMQDYGDLQRRIGEFAQMCSDGKLTKAAARNQLAPLLREARAAIVGADLWASRSDSGGGAAASQ